MPGENHLWAEPTLKVWRRWHTAQFAQAIEDLQQWERDRDRYGVGQVSLTFSLDRRWTVWISRDLETTVIPF